MAEVDPFAEFRASPDGPIKITVRPQDATPDPFAEFTHAQSASDHPINMGASAAIGLRHGLTLGGSDEILGLSAAGQTMVPEGGRDKLHLSPLGHIISAIGGLGRIGYEALTAPPNTLSTQITGQPARPATEAYSKAKAEEVETQKQAYEQNPASYMLGDVGGMVAAPLGAVAAPAKAGAGIGGRMLAGAKTGGVIGGVSGALEGEGVQGRAVGAGLGAPAGFMAGGALPLAISGAGNVASFLGKITHLDQLPSAIRALWGLDKESSKVVGNALLADERAGGMMTPAQDAAANAAGQPIVNVDAAGDATRRLLRTATNISPEASDKAGRFLQNRFDQQTSRAEQFARDLSPLGGRAGRTREQITADAISQNSPAYRAAYAAGDRPIRSAELETLTGSDAVKEAMKRAVTTGKDRAIVDGLGAFNPGVKITADGQVIFQKGRNGVPTYPNIQFWDYVQREMGEAITKAKGRGEAGTQEVGRLSKLQERLQDELDRLVPEFGAAREGAAGFFSAKNMVDAGRNFVMNKFNLDVAAKKLKDATPAERALFAEGYVSELADKVSKVPDKANLITRITQNTDAKRRAEMALGPGGAEKLEMFMRIENIMHKAKEALGNSTTARQWRDIAVFGLGTGGLDAAIHGNMDLKSLMYGSMVAGTVAGRQAINNRLATRVADMLLSNDPAVLQRAVQIARQSATARSFIRNAENVLERVVGQKIGAETGSPATPEPTDGQQ